MAEVPRRHLPFQLNDMLPVIETAEANGLNPFTYLKFIFQDLHGAQFGQYPEFLEDYLPWNPKIQTICKEDKT